MPETLTLERIAELRDNPPPDCGWRLCADSFQEYLALLDLAEAHLKQTAAPLTPFRVGGTVPLNVYEGERPVFQAHTPEEAARLVELLNRGLKQIAE